MSAAVFEECEGLGYTRDVAWLLLELFFLGFLKIQVYIVCLKGHNEARVLTHRKVPLVGEHGYVRIPPL